ncbi:MAG: EI24 domain-containing protein [Chitinophagaceae bacterium]|nr:EI24 domain-containing protein [Chitinophagaceae bacterium]
MLKEIVIAFQSWSEAHRFIRQHKLWKWILIPGIIYTALFAVGIYFFVTSANGAVSWASDQMRIESWLQQKRSEWLSFFFVMMGMMLRLILVLFYFSLFKYLILIIGSPVFAYLSEKTEAIIENKEHSFNWKELRKDAARSIRMALRNCLWQTLYLFGLVIMCLLPIIGWITPVIALFLECYYYGFSMLDFSFARNKFTPQQSIQFIGRHKGLAIGNGMLFYFMHTVIIFAPAYAIVAATLSFHKVKNS